MSKRQHIPISQREPVTLERSANSRDLRGELVATGSRKIWAKDCQHMLRELSDDSHADFQALSALSIEDLATLRYLLVQIEGVNEGLLQKQQRYRRRCDTLLVVSAACILIVLFFILPLIRIFLFGEPPT